MPSHAFLVFTSFVSGSLAIIATIFSATSCGAAEPTPRPNVVLIMADDMGYSDLGCYGSDIDTPNLNRLANGGVRFTQFYNTGRCCPTRACLLTGLYPHQAGIGHMTEDKGLPGYRGELNDHCVTIAEVMRPAGYATFMVGKWHVVRNANVRPDGDKANWPLQRGFDRFYGTITGAGSFYDPGTLTRDNQMISPFADKEYQPEQYYYTNAMGDHAVRFITEHQAEHKEQPFFMYLAFTSAHWPMHALEADIAKYRGKYDAGYEAVRQARLSRMQSLGLADRNWETSPIFGDWEKMPHKEWEARCMEVYAAMIDRMDQNIGKIVATLEKSGTLDNTLILFLQDNGACQEGIGRQPMAAGAAEKKFPVIADDAIRLDVIPKQMRDGSAVLMGPQHMPGGADTYIAYGEAWANVSNVPFRLYKHFVHEGGISSPLIVHWPAGIPAERRNTFATEPAHLIDLMATCVDVGQANYPTERQGSKVTPREGVSLQPAWLGKELQRPNPIFWEHEGNRAVRDGQWKLVAKENKPWELYDIPHDRTEMHDLSEQQPQIAKEMAAKWDAWAERANVLPLSAWRGNAATGGRKGK